MKLFSPVERITKEEFNRLIYSESTTPFPKWLYGSFASHWDEITNVLTIYHGYKLLKFSVYCHPYDLKFTEAVDIIREGHNQLIYQERLAAYNKRKKPVCGDKVKFQDGTILTISIINYNEDFSVEDIQVSNGGSCYLCSEGTVSFSGGCGNLIDFKKLALTDERINDTIWFFDENISGAGRGVYYKFPFKVWKVKEVINT